MQAAEVWSIVAEPVFFAWAECPLLSAERQKNSLKFVQLSTNTKRLTVSTLLFLCGQGFLRLLLPEMYPKDCPYFSHTHLTENAFSGILSVSQGRRAEKPAFFRLFCVYGEDNLWQP